MVANDGGDAVSFDTGGSWTEQDFSTVQFYHAVATAHVPFHVCGSQQDNSTLCLPSYFWGVNVSLTVFDIGCLLLGLLGLLWSSLRSLI